MNSHMNARTHTHKTLVKLSRTFNTYLYRTFNYEGDEVCFDSLSNKQANKVRQTKPNSRQNKVNSRPFTTQQNGDCVNTMVNFR